MDINKWVFPTAFSHWDHEERAAIARVHASGQYTMGKEVEAFEAEIAAYHGRKYAIMVNSGSSANLLAVEARLLPQIVTVPAIAWATTYAPLLQRGLDLSVWDCDDTWNADQCRPIMVACSILGSPIGDVAGKNCWIEDNCESLGAVTQEGRLTGTFGMMSTLSFFYSHQISAIEGGAILTDNDDIAYLCRVLRNHGNDGWGSDDFEAQYNFQCYGYNLRPLELHAAIARAQLVKLPDMIAERRWNASYFRLQVGAPVVKHQQWRGTPSPFGLAFEVESREQRRKLVTALKAEGIDCRLPTGGSFLRHPYAKEYQGQKTPNADRIHERGLFLGCPPYKAPDLIDKAVAVIRRTL